MGEFLSMLRKRALWDVLKVTIDDVTKYPDYNAFLDVLWNPRSILITGNLHHFPEKKFSQL